MLKVFTIKSEAGIPLNVCIVDEGDYYGNGIVHDKEDPQVIFHDSRYKGMGEYGNYVSSYYMSTLLDRPEDVGLVLHAGLSEYTVDGKTMNEVLGYLKMYDQGFSMDSFNREEMKEVAFLYSDYVCNVSEDALYTGNTPATLSEFVENDLQFYVEDMIGQGGKGNEVHMHIKRKMEFCGYEFDQDVFEKASKSYLKNENGKFQGLLSSENERVGVVGVLEIYNTNNEDNVIGCDITYGSYEHWLNISGMDGDVFGEYAMYPMSEVLNNETYDFYEENIKKNLTDYEIRHTDFDEGFKKELEGFFAEYETDIDKVSKRRNNEYER